MGEINWQTISCNVKLTYKSSLQEKKGVFLRGNLGHRGTAQCRVSEPRQGEHGVHAWEWGWAWGESELGEASVWEGRYPHVGSMPKQGEEASTWGKERAGPIQQRMSGPKQKDIYSLRRRGPGDNRQFIIHIHRDWEQINISRMW